MKSRHGFTLIELSIVLVIIGLLVGGVLVGRDLIHAAEIRKTIKQTEQFDAAINTFRNKFNCLPGDCTNPAEFGFTNAEVSSNGRNTQPPVGNGDGKISDDAGSPESENAFWWLENAGLLDGVNIAYVNGVVSYYSVIPAVIQSFQPYSTGGWSISYATWNILYIDTSKDLATTNTFVTQSGHYYLLSSDVEFYNAGAISPADAFAIDAKMDDGLPRSGRVLASGNDSGDNTDQTWYLPVFTGTTDVGAAGANSPYCVTNASPNQYNVLNTNTENDTSYTAMGPFCGLGIKASF